VKDNQPTLSCCISVSFKCCVQGFLFSNCKDKFACEIPTRLSVQLPPLFEYYLFHEPLKREALVGHEWFSVTCGRDLEVVGVAAIY
jgi:hypothetical protein